MIKVRGKRMYVPLDDRLLGYEDDNKTKNLYFAFEPNWATKTFGLSDDIAFLAKIQKPSQSKAVSYPLIYDAELTTSSTLVYRLEVLNDIVSTPGEVLIQLMVAKDMGVDENEDELPDLIWSSDIESFGACESLAYTSYTGTSGSAQLTAFETIASEIGINAQKAIESATEAAKSAEEVSETAKTVLENCVKVNEIYEVAVDAMAGKLDKQAGETDLPRVYGVNTSGKQTMYDVMNDAEGHPLPSLPYLHTYVAEKAEEAAASLAALEANVTSLESSVNDSLTAKVDRLPNYSGIYPGVYTTMSSDGAPQLLTATSDLTYITDCANEYIAMYSTDKQLKTSTPTEDDSAANKAYVDAQIPTTSDALENNGFFVENKALEHGAPNRTQHIAVVAEGHMMFMSEAEKELVDGLGEDYEKEGHQHYIEFLTGFSMNGRTITKLGGPYKDTDAANKAYVDEKAEEAAASLAALEANVGTVDTALDSILAIQNTLLGGEAV